LSIGYSEPVTSNRYIENIIVDNVYINGGKQHGIALGRSNNVLIRNNKVSYVMATGIWTYYASNLRIIDNYVNNSEDDGIYTASNGADTYVNSESKNIIIDRNFIINAGAKGIGCGGPSGVIITNNTINNTWAQGIMVKDDQKGGHQAAREVIISNNILNGIFTNYGNDQSHYQKNSVVSVKGGTYGIIEAFCLFELIVSNNIINDTAGIGQRGLWLCGKKITITGNSAELWAPIGVVIGADNPQDYLNVHYFSMTGNNIEIAYGRGSQALSLMGVNSGVVSGNYFDCGGQGVQPNLGKFLVTQMAQNIFVTGNNIKNYTTLSTNNAASVRIQVANNMTSP
jgi:parallel beta-helix repeat protein